MVSPVLISDLDSIRWLTMDTISSALELVYQNRYVEYWTRDPIYRASLRTSLLGSLFFNLANTLLIMNLVELGNGFLFCLTESRTPLQRGMRYAGIASCIALFIIAIASFGCLNEDWTRYLEWLYNEFPPTGRKLKAAHDIILFAWAIVLLVFGVLVLWKVRHSYTLKNVSRLSSLHQHHRQRHETTPRVLLLTLSHPCSLQFSFSSPLSSTLSAAFTVSYMSPSSSSPTFLGIPGIIRPSCSSIRS